MKQTAVEFLYEAIDNELIDFLESRIDLNELSVAMLKAKQKAVKMEKDQIMDAWMDGMEGILHEMAAANYYQQTYGKQYTNATNNQ